MSDGPRPGAGWWPWLLSLALLTPLLVGAVVWREDLGSLLRIVLLELRRIVS